MKVKYTYEDLEVIDEKVCDSLDVPGVLFVKQAIHNLISTPRVIKIEIQTDEPAHITIERL